MSAPRVRRAFMVFHAVLAGVLLIMGHNALYHSLHEHGFGHLALVAALELIGAILLLIPRTLKIGGTALLVVAHSRIHCPSDQGRVGAAAADLRGGGVLHHGAWRRMGSPGNRYRFLKADGVLRSILLLTALAAPAAAQDPVPVEGDFVVTNFQLRSGAACPSSGSTIALSADPNGMPGARYGTLS